MHELKEQASHIAELTTDLKCLYSHISTRLIFAASDLRNVIERRAATQELADSFNSTELRNIDLRFTEFHSVAKIALTTLRFKLRIHLIYQSTQVYKIDPFHFWVSLTEKPEPKEYHGPPFVLFESSNNCLKGLEDMSETLIQNECLVNGFHDPNIKLRSTLNASTNLTSQDVSNVKTLPGNNFIYCFQLSVSLMVRPRVVRVRFLTRT